MSSWRKFEAELGISVNQTGFEKKLFNVYLPFYVRKAFASQLFTLLKSERELNNKT